MDCNTSGVSGGHLVSAGALFEQSFVLSQGGSEPRYGGQGEDFLALSAFQLSNLLAVQFLGCRCIATGRCAWVQATAELIYLISDIPPLKLIYVQLISQPQPLGGGEDLISQHVSIKWFLCRQFTHQPVNLIA